MAPEIQDSSQAPARACRSGRSFRAWITLLLIAAAGVALDLGSKAWAFRDWPMTRAFLRAHPDWTPPASIEPILPAGLLNKQLVFNYGAVFGLGAHQRFFFIAFTLGALAVGLLVFARTTNAHHRLAHISIGMVLAGGVGNLYDRVALGPVRDFLHMLPNVRLPFDWTWPGGSNELFPWVFNIADMLLLLGMALLMLHLSRVERQRKTTSLAEEVIAVQS